MNWVKRQLSAFKREPAPAPAREPEPEPETREQLIHRTAAIYEECCEQVEKAEELVTRAKAAQPEAGATMDERVKWRETLAQAGATFKEAKKNRYNAAWNLSQLAPRAVEPGHLDHRTN